MLSKQELDFISRLKTSGIPDVFLNPFVKDLLNFQNRGVSEQIEQTRKIMEKLKPVSFYESLGEDARKGFDYAAGRKRIEISVVQPKAKVMCFPEQIERLEKLVGRVEKLAEQVYGENYAENEYKN